MAEPSVAAPLASKRSHSSQKPVANSSSDMGRLSICILSLTNRRCGEVYSPTLDGSLSAGILRSVGRYCARIEEIKQEVEPLPLVPAMWIGFNRSKSEGYSQLF